MHLWRRRVAAKWLEDRAESLRALVGERLVTIERPNFRSVILEVTCSSRDEARKIMQDFGGQIEKLPHNWLKVYARAQVRPPLRIGKRLVVVDGEKASVGEAANFPVSEKLAASLREDIERSNLVIPSGAAFGTGGHATTAMTLRLLEEITRKSKPGWSLADLGTGSGILALAARRLGAGAVVAIDNDPIAIATAKGNARLNRIRGVEFQIADARVWRPRGKMEVVTANLFSELLIESLPRIRGFLARDGALIVSGILRSQEREVNKALRRNGFEIMKGRRRGKWVALSSRAKSRDL